MEGRSEDVALQLVRVMGTTMARRLADAIVSAFPVNIEPDARQQDPVGLAVARANAEAVALLPVVGDLEMLLRQHLIASRRTVLEELADTGYESHGSVSDSWTSLSRQRSRTNCRRGISARC